MKSLIAGLVLAAGVGAGLAPSAQAMPVTGPGASALYHGGISIGFSTGGGGYYSRPYQVFEGYRYETRTVWSGYYDVYGNPVWTTQTVQIPVYRTVYPSYGGPSFRIGGTSVHHFGPGMDSASTITEWDVPHRFAAEGSWGRRHRS